MPKDIITNSNSFNMFCGCKVARLLFCALESTKTKTDFNILKGAG